MKEWFIRGCVIVSSVLLYVLFWYNTLKPIELTVGVYAGSYWGTSVGNMYQVLDKAIRIYEEEHPGVKVRYVSGIGKDDYSEWLAEQFMKGTGPDEAFDLSCYYDACKNAGQMAGRQYALPYESVPTLMFVNKSLLEEYGINMPSHSWTWDDFYQICSQITEASAEGSKEKAYGVYNYSWTDMLYANDAVLFSEDGKKCYLGNLKVRDAVLFDQKLRELNNGYTVTARDFDSGRVAFRPFLFSDYKVYQPYPWRVKKYSNFEWDCVEMPAGPRGSNVCEIESTLIGMNSRTRHKEIVWDLMKLLSADEDLQKEMFSSSVGLSPLIAVAEDREVLDRLFQGVPGDKAIDREVIHDIMNTGVAAPRFRRYSQAKIMAESAVDSALESGKVLENYLTSSQHDINIMLGA